MQTSSVSVVYNDMVIDPIVESITWSGDIKQAPRTLDVTLTNTADGVTRLIDFEVGTELRLLLMETGAELFRGIIFTTNIDVNGRMTLTAYDENVYLTKNFDTKKFTNQTATSIIRQLCDEFGVPYGELADTGYVIPKLIREEMSLWDMMVTALTLTREQTGRRFYIYSRGGLLYLAERKEKVAIMVIEVGTNLLHATYRASIEDLRNQIKVLGGTEKKPIAVTVKDQALIERFGLMQHVETVNQSLNASQVRQRADKLLSQMAVIDDEASVESIGNPEIVAGTAVYVIEPMTGILGAYYVSADTHTFEDGMHRMDLRLTATDDLPAIEYTPPIEKRKKAKKKRKGNAINIDVEALIREATGG